MVMKLVSVTTDPIRALVQRDEEFAIIDLEGRRQTLLADETAAWERVSDLMQQIARTEEQVETAKKLLADLLNQADGDIVAAFEGLIARFDAEAEKIIRTL